MWTHTGTLLLGLMLGAFLGIFLHAILSVAHQADQCMDCRLRIAGALTANDLLWLTEEPTRLDVRA